MTESAAAETMGAYVDDLTGARPTGVPGGSAPSVGDRARRCRRPPALSPHVVMAGLVPLPSGSVPACRARLPLTPALSPPGRGRVAAPLQPPLLPSRLREGPGEGGRTRLPGDPLALALSPAGRGDALEPSLPSPLPLAPDCDPGLAGGEKVRRGRHRNSPSPRRGEGRGEGASRATAGRDRGPGSPRTSIRGKPGPRNKSGVTRGGRSPRRKPEPDSKGLGRP